MLLSKQKITQHMISIVVECEDPLTGEVSRTSLAEQAAEYFNCYENEDYDIPEELFEWAQEVADKHEAENAKASQGQVTKMPRVRRNEASRGV